MPRPGASSAKSNEARRSGDLLCDQSGAVFTEYLIVLAFAGLLVAVALAAFAPKEVRSYSSRRAVLYDAQHP